MWISYRDYYGQRAFVNTNDFDSIAYYISKNQEREGLFFLELVLSNVRSQQERILIAGFDKDKLNANDPEKAAKMMGENMMKEIGDALSRNVSIYEIQQNLQIH